MCAAIVVVCTDSAGQDVASSKLMRSLLCLLDDVCVLTMATHTMVNAQWWWCVDAVLLVDVACKTLATYDDDIISCHPRADVMAVAVIS